MFEGEREPLFVTDLKKAVFGMAVAFMSGGGTACFRFS